MTVTLLAKPDGTHDDLTALWKAVPDRARGYRATLRRLHVHETRPSADELHGTHEGRFFWPGGELVWRRVQTYDGQTHGMGYHLLRLGDESDPPAGFTALTLTPTDKQERMFLWEGLYQAGLTSPGMDRVPVVHTQPLVDRGNIIVHRQWVDLSDVKKEVPA